MSKYQQIKSFLAAALDDDKNSKVEYSTDMCIKDRLATIESLYPDKYALVIANILLAKKFFKEIGIYKRFDGGLGGVGVENFILQHNGSFYDAASHFVAVADSCDMKLEEFKLFVKSIARKK